MEDDDGFPPPPELTPLNGGDIMDIERPRQNPLGGWNPRVFVNRRAMEEALLQATTPQKIGRVEGPYSRDPDRSKLRTDFGETKWEEIFPNEPPTSHPSQQNRQDSNGINWDNWNPGTGTSSRELVARLEKHQRRCWNPACSSAATGVAGSDLITPENRHDYWDLAWTRRTGIGTALPWYNVPGPDDNPRAPTSCKHGVKVGIHATSSDQIRYDHDPNVGETPSADANSTSHSHRPEAAPASKAAVNSEFDRPVTPTRKKKGAATTKNSSARVRLDLEPQSEDVSDNETEDNANDESCTPRDKSKMKTSTTITPLKRKHSQADLDAKMKKMKMDVDSADDPFW